MNDVGIPGAGAKTRVKASDADAKMGLVANMGSASRIWSMRCRGVRALDQRYRAIMSADQKPALAPSTRQDSARDGPLGRKIPAVASAEGQADPSRSRHREREAYQQRDADGGSSQPFTSGACLLSCVTNWSTRATILAPKGVEVEQHSGARSVP